MVCSFHRTIKMTPSEVNAQNEEKIRARQYSLYISGKGYSSFEVFAYRFVLSLRILFNHPILHLFSSKFLIYLFIYLFIKIHHMQHK